MVGITLALMRYHGFHGFQVSLVSRIGFEFFEKIYIYKPSAYARKGIHPLIALVQPGFTGFTVSTVSQST